MKKFFLAAVSAFAALSIIALNTSAQTPAAAAVEAPGLLYEISGKDLKKPSYVFGTIHVICPADMFSMEKIGGYLDQTDRLIMELDMDDAAEMQAMGKGIMMPDGKTLKDYLTAAEYAKVDEMFVNVLGTSVEPMKQFKPFLLAVMITANPKTLGCSPPASYETTLLQTAVAKKKGVEGLETVASQFAVLEKTPMEKQAKDLYEMALNPQKSLDEFKKLLDSYKAQNSDNLYDIMNAQMTEEKSFQTTLLDDRNKAWVPKIEKAIAEKPSFIAVGGGHLGGKNGVLAMLKAKGYKVRAIKL